MAFITLDKKILDWEWYTDVNTSKLFIHCILKANFKNGSFKGMDVPRGSFVTSVAKLSKETGLTNRNVRTCLEKLEKSENLTSKTTNKFTLISVINYDKYQLYTGKSDKQSDKRLTNNRQTTDKQTDNNRTSIYKNKQEEKEKYLYKADAPKAHRSQTQEKDKNLSFLDL